MKNRPDRTGELDFTGSVAVVTGAGAGLGRAYALAFARAGARVVVNARRADVAHELVEAIRRDGGEATAAVSDARHGGRIVDLAIGAYGKVDALVVNAGRARDRTFVKMTASEWQEVLDVHLGGAFTATRAAWPHMIARGAGRIVLVTSGAGLHGNFGQANYAAAKAGIIGLAKSLAVEGHRHGISVNAVAPMALTEMTRAVFDDDQRAGLPASAVVPFVLALAHPDSDRTGTVVEVGGGWGAEVRWERAAGIRLSPPHLSAAAVLADWGELCRFDDHADHPTSTSESLAAAIDRNRTSTPPDPSSSLREETDQ